MSVLKWRYVAGLMALSILTACGGKDISHISYFGCK